MIKKTYITPEDRRYFRNIIILFPIASLICWLPAYLLKFFETINLHYFTVYTNDNKDFLFNFYIFSNTLISLEGFFTAILYGYDIR